MEMEEYGDERRARVNSAENSEEEDGDEALSLCDLPLIHQSTNDNEQHSSTSNQTQDPEDFDFCSLSIQSPMRAADEIFHQGQILPLRHSLSCKKEIILSRSESMDRYFSGGLISSRSSSISSGSGSSAAAEAKLPPRNQFHSPPSPSPKLNYPRNRINGRNCAKKSSAWNVFRLGLVAAPPEIAFQDLKSRCSGKGVGDGGSRSEKKRSYNKAWGFRFLGGCKCSVGTVCTVPSEVVVMKRSVSDSASEMRVIPGEEDNLLGVKSDKKRLSHPRTFEWLKQLSLEATPHEP